MSEPKDDKGRDPLDVLAQALVEGKVELVEVRIRVCWRCKTSTLRHKPTPAWMNRWVCDHCGAKVSG